MPSCNSSANSARKCQRIVPIPNWRLHPKRNPPPRVVALALPEERRRIQRLLEKMPEAEESKTGELLRGLRDLWAVNPGEKIVIFTTYLGSVDTLRRAIDSSFRGAGVEVIKGGDHGAKVAAERRFKRADGPRS